MVRPAGLSAARNFLANRRFFFAAVRADTVKFENVIVQNEAKFFRDFFLKAFNFVIFKFDDFLARRAGQVIVVIFSGPFVTSGHSAHANFADKILFRQRSQKTVDGRETDRRIFCGDRFEDVLRGEVVRTASHDFENQKSLIGHFQTEIADDLFARRLIDARFAAVERFLR